jgi:hypothetical protein
MWIIARGWFINIDYPYFVTVGIGRLEGNGKLALPFKGTGLEYWGYNQCCQ